MSNNSIEQNIISIAPEFCRANGIRSLRMFGSRLRGTERDDSDLDLIADFKTDRSVGLFELSRMQIELSDALGINVDIRTLAELSRYFRESTLNESRIIYAE